MPRKRLSLLTITLRTRYRQNCRIYKFAAGRNGPRLTEQATSTWEEAPTKILLIVKSAVEVLAGLALVLFPLLTVSVLLGPRLAEPVGVALARVAGVALLTLGIACWLARNESQSRASRGLIAALFFYDVAIVTILLSARLRAGLSGIGLLPAVVLHSGLGVWSLLCLRKETYSPVQG